MKKDLEILEIDDANKDGTPRTTTTNKRYTKFNTSEGWMACFDVKVCEAVKKLIHKVAGLEVIESGAYKNITKCYGESDALYVSPDGKVGCVKVEHEDHTIKGVVKPFEKDPVGLAVAVFCEIVKYVDGKPEKAQEIMKQSIELIKQAQEAFK